MSGRVGTGGAIASGGLLLLLGTDSSICNELSPSGVSGFSPELFSLAAAVFCVAVSLLGSALVLGLASVSLASVVAPFVVLVSFFSVSPSRLAASSLSSSSCSSFQFSRKSRRKRK